MAAVCPVVGQGLCGSPRRDARRRCGLDVIGFDADAAKVKRLNAGDSYMEDVGDDVVRSALGSGRYRAVMTPDGIDGFDVAVITVPTPLREGAPDLGHIEVAATRSVITYARVRRSSSSPRPIPARPKRSSPPSSRTVPA